MIGSCLRWMIRTENPNERDVHLKAGLEYKLSQHCSSPMNTQHPKGSLWQEWIRSYFTDLQIPDAWGRLWQLWRSPQTYMALQITYQFTQLVKHSLKPQHFAPAKLRHTKQGLPTYTIYINFQLWRAVCCLGSYYSSTPEVFPTKKKISQALPWNSELSQHHGPSASMRLTHPLYDGHQGKGVKVAHFPNGWKWGVGSSSNHNHGEISSPRPPKNLTTNAVQVRLLSFV